jgi:Cu/Ag efflux pump CusA
VVQEPIAIERAAVSRRIDVTAGVSGRSLSAVAGDIRARLARLSMPLEYHAEVLESTAGAEIGTIGMLAVAAAAALAAYLLLQAAFGSWRLAALVLLLLPVALVGGVIAALVPGVELSLGSMLGLLALFGIAVRISVLLVRHFQERPPDERGAGDRLASVVTSVSALALLALPFALLGTRPGLEVVQPLAVVLLCGLVTVTFVGLFLLPAVYPHLAVPASSGTTIAGALVRRWPGAEREPVRVAGDGPDAAASDDVATERGSDHRGHAERER